MKNIKTKTNLKTCSSCDRSFYPEDVIYYFKNTGGDILCATCGEVELYIHDFTLHDEYPYVIDDEFDGGQYLGDPFKKIIY